ncbi:MAG: uracil-DNA glycosylase [Denitromonas halophila]|nr:MAG: uracil-DNA glycosylase [Denitromonas halophila]TVT67617.1 MAG: uracil-DNA glycosylase [Denitromonas halophila]
MDKPKLLADANALAERLSQLEEAHIAPLTKFVRRLRNKMGPDAAIPYFDPWDGGIDAEVLFLLEAPGPKAKNSGFVSMNNPDETAKNFFEICKEACIERKRTVTWNTVPWYIGSENRIRPAKSDDITSGIESLAELLQLLPKLKGIVLVGRKAQTTASYVKRIAPTLKIFTSPHPSPLFINRKPEHREQLLDSWRTVQSSLEHQRSNEHRLG